MRDETTFLRRVLLADAGISGGAGLLMALAPLEALLGLPDSLLRLAGLALLPGAIFLAWLAARPLPPAGLVWLVVAANAAWALECLALPLLGWVQPTTLGLVFLLGQGVAVALLAELEWLGLRRQRAVVA